MVLPFREYRITLEKKGYQKISRIIKTDLPAFTYTGKLTFTGGLILMGAGFIASTPMKSLIYAASSLPFLILSLSLPQRLHFLIPDNTGKTEITSIPPASFYFPSRYYPASKKFPITILTRKHIDSTGKARRVITGKRVCLLKAGVFAELLEEIHYQEISITLFPGKRTGLSIRGIASSLKLKGAGIKLQFVFPLWNGDIYQSLQLRAGIGGDFISSDEKWISAPLDLDYRFTSTTTLTVTFSAGYNPFSQRPRLFTGFGIGFLL